MLLLADGTRTWADPGHVAANRLPMRAPLVPYPSADLARTGDPGATPWLQSLDGRWRFVLLDRPEAVTAEHVDPDTDDGSWDRIDVPGCWTVQGYDRPHYTNIQMPFPGRPPEIPDVNPTGVYRTSFRVPAAWRGRRVVLHVGGAESVLYVYVNGHRVGSSTDSRLAAEFDVTPYLRPGVNTLACVVVRWSASSYVEDQDHWWMAGLHRTVHLRAEGRVRLADVEADAGLDDDLSTGALRVRASVAFDEVTAIAEGWSVEAVLESLTGRRVARREAAVPHVLSPYVFRGHVVELVADVPTVRRWTAETPHLYRLVVTLRDPSGSVAEATSLRVGFRRVEVRAGRLRVNGSPIRIRGVNRHDHHPDRGKAVTPADVGADLLLMKEHNVNAVRCSHYPNDPVLLDLCDELGLYVIDEANIESHAWNDWICRDPVYREQFVERGARMVQRDRNHACVIAWSLGNESGYGPNHDALAGWIRSAEPSRPLHYEGAIFGDWDGGRHATDLVCPMYAPIDAIVAWAERGPHDRPLVLCEYEHAMGNSNGSLADYEEAFDTHPALQGGFVWEWKDHGLRQRLVDGRERYAYGGQFGDEPNDANFVADGLVAPDLVPHPAMRELAWVFRPVGVTATPAQLRRGRVRVKNRQDFAGLAGLRATWEVAIDGVVVQHGRLDLPDIAPGRAADVPVPFSPVDLGPGQEAHLTVRFVTRRATAWAPAGHEVAWDQVALPWKASRRQPAAGPLEAEPLVDASTGTLLDLQVGDRSLLAAPLELLLWRAPVDNDGLKLRPLEARMPLHRWRALGLDHLEQHCTGIDVRGDRVRSSHELRCAGGALHYRSDLRLDAGGVEGRFELEVPEAVADLPRIGHTFEVPPSLERVRWLGLGPHESYPDRRSSAVVGRFEAGADELPYLMPQSFGLRCGVRWWAVEELRRGGLGLLVVAGDPGELACSATYHTEADLEAARDLTDLVHRPGIVVHVDVAHRGLGTASCGPDTLPRYRIPAGIHRWSWRLLPYVVGRHDPARLARGAR